MHQYPYHFKNPKNAHFNYDGVFLDKTKLYLHKPIRETKAPEIELEYCRIFIDMLCVRSNKFYRRGSYGMKHFVQAFFNQYVSNGALIQAFIEKGYEIQVVGNGPNCRIKFEIEINVRPFLKGIPQSIRKSRDDLKPTKESVMLRLGEIALNTPRGKKKWFS